MVFFREGSSTGPSGRESGSTSGGLLIIDESGCAGAACPLRHTEVTGRISGFVASVSVKQQFHNPTSEKIEAVYTFPLPEDAAVDGMQIKVGSRIIFGEIHRREKALQIYEAARAAGHVAALLDQERPNIFTQAVTNIMPGEQVDVTISYVQLLKYEDGEYEFVFPMVVGPRYVPGLLATGFSGTGTVPDTDQVRDASRITPPVTPKGTRAGHDISLSIDIDTFLPVRSIDSKLHEVECFNPDPQTLRVTLKNRETIPNKDFVLRYTQAADDVQTGIIAHAPDTTGYFALVFQPPSSPKPTSVSPKEMIFVLDTSGSQSGEPLRKSKETLFHCIRNLNPGDTFNLIDFSTSPRLLFKSARPFNAENEKRALDYVERCNSAGGTEIIPALKVALQSRADRNRLRIVVVFTDGYVGNEFAILDFVQRNLGSARVFCFGIGNGVNRFLIEKMAQIGRGAADFVLLDSDGQQVARKFYERIRNPIVTDISIDWNGLPVVVEETYPSRLPDLFDSQPLVVKGRFSAPASGEVTIRGNVAGSRWVQKVPVDFPERKPENQAIASIWARAKIEDLMDKDPRGLHRGHPSPAIEKQIVDVALAHRLVTQFTSFVAVEKKVVTSGGEPRTISVPVEMPAGVSYEGIYGGDDIDEFAGEVQPFASFQAPRFVSFYLQECLRISPGPATPRCEPCYYEVTENELSEQETWRPAEEKLDSDLKQLLAKFTESGGKGICSTEGLPVGDESIEVMIWVKDASDERLETMKQLGLTDFEWAVEGRIMFGRIPLAKLEELARLDFVIRISSPDYS